MNWLTDWPTYLLKDCWTDGLMDWLTDWGTDWLAHWVIEGLSDSLTNLSADRPTNWMSERQRPTKLSEWFKNCVQGTTLFILTVSFAGASSMTRWKRFCSWSSSLSIDFLLSGRSRILFLNYKLEEGHSEPLNQGNFLHKITKMLTEICLLCPSKFTSNSTILIASKSRERLLDDFTHMGQVSQRVLRASFHEKVMNKQHTISPSSKSSFISMLPLQNWCLSKMSFSTKGLLVFANIPRKIYELNTSETRAAICLSLSKVLWHRGQPLEWTSSLSSLETYLE